MLKVSHIIHPGIVPPTSDLVIAQPITFETMKSAREFAKGDIDVTLYAIQYHDEDRLQLPGCFIRTPDLNRSISDIKTFKEKRKLALIKDILDALYETGDTDYLIYTNVDIALQPYFYQAVAKFIEQGYDAFVINRRTILDKFTTPNQIPLMYAQVGEPHKGYDCFVFKRDLYPKFKLGVIFIGTAWIGRALLANMVTYATKFKEFRDEHLTFHIGDPCSWRREEFSDYFQQNRNEYLKIFNQLEAEHGIFEPVWRSYLLDTGPKRIIPNSD
ncbi:MAG: hypothetical protein PVH61_29555 [Candidatus Aminicenantes bacterium]|jgi:hypothetical protein